MAFFCPKNGVHLNELIRELYRLVAGLDANVEKLQRDIDRHEAVLNRLTESLATLSNRVSVLEHQVADLRKAMEEQARRWWSFLPAIVAALVGSIFTLLTQLLLSYLRK